MTRTRSGRARLTESLGDPLGLGAYVELDDRDLLSRTTETDMPDAPRQLLPLLPTILERLDVTVPSGVALDGVPFSEIAAATQPLVR